MSNFITIQPGSTTIETSIQLPFSKSESNRALIIQRLCDTPFNIENLSEAEDTKVLTEALKTFETKSHIDVGHAGTAFRFLTAFLAIQEGNQTLTGSDRMKQRPIRALVEALNQLGADIRYLEKEGFPPLSIGKSTIKGYEVDIPGNISSQYISALLLIAPTLPNGIQINFTSPLTSVPYLKMTVDMMLHFGIEAEWLTNQIKVKPKPYTAKHFNVEADWSAASYWYEIAAFSKNPNILLLGLKKESQQGDSCLPKLFKAFGVKSRFTQEGVLLTKNKKSFPNIIELDLSDTPDLAQTIACTCAGLGTSCMLTGLHTLKIKETNRLSALQKELFKIGIHSEITEDSFYLPKEQKVMNGNLINTHNDHRMAMAMAPLTIKTKHLQIEKPEVVNKSYPHFWKDLEKAGFKIS